MTRRRGRSRLDGPIVVDANVLFSALLRDSTTRHLLFYGSLNLHTPNHIWGEFKRNRPYLLKKSHATNAAFDLLLDELKELISDIPRPLIRGCMDEVRASTGRIGDLDAPYVAAALALDATLWTQDKRLREAAPVPTVTTADVARARGLP